jgi:hypothetical protein
MRGVFRQHFASFSRRDAAQKRFKCVVEFVLHFVRWGTFLEFANQGTFII